MIALCPFRGWFSMIFSFFSILTSVSITLSSFSFLLGFYFFTDDSSFYAYSLISLTLVLFFTYFFLFRALLMNIYSETAFEEEGSSTISYYSLTFSSSSSFFFPFLLLQFLLNSSIISTASSSTGHLSLVGWMSLSSWIYTNFLLIAI